ncbi:MAG TPA: TIGR03790 family protein [Verrucomicrobiota bacterium]|nr:TIGR03790 family protein [Verrucomicrobiota bacterium]
MNSSLNRFILCLGVALAPLALAAASGDEVVVVYNTRVPESKAVAEHYAKRREVPPDQVIGLALPTEENMTRAQFRNSLERPLAEAFSKRKLWRITAQTIRDTNNRPVQVEWTVSESKIRYLVLCYGVPIRVTRDENLEKAEAEKVRQEFRRNEACVDNELMLLPRIEQNWLRTGPYQNHIFGTTNTALLHPTNNVLLVSRLDGPTPEIARSLVDKAIEAETHGLWGRAYVDIRSTPDPAFKIGEDWMKGAAEVCRRLGFETVVDTNAATFRPEFPMSQIAFYFGWYDASVSGPFARKTVEFMPGAFAYHLHSYSGASPRSDSRNWVGPLLARGVTATMGSVDEPYLGGTPDLAVFASRLIYSGFTFGEAACAAQNVLSWQTIVIGDPLYRPFGTPAEELHKKLEADYSEYLQWSYLRLINVNIANGVPPVQMAAYLSRIPLTKESAVLTEKLGDLYSQLGKPSSAIEMWERALALKPSPLQRLRLRLTLAEKLPEQSREQEAVEQLSALLKENPDYPAKADIYQRLAALARKLGKEEAARAYEDQSRNAAGK